MSDDDPLWVLVDQWRRHDVAGCRDYSCPDCAVAACADDLEGILTAISDAYGTPCRQCGPGYRIGDDGCRHGAAADDPVARAKARNESAACEEAALAETRATLCGHGIPHNDCKENHDG